MECYDECCDGWNGTSQPAPSLTSDEALAELRRKLSGDSVLDAVKDDSGEQHDVRYTLSIIGPPFAHPSAADFIVDAAGDAVQKEIREALDRCAQDIADALGGVHTVTFR